MIRGFILTSTCAKTLCSKRGRCVLVSSDGLWPSVSAVQVRPAGGVWMEVVLAHAGGVVGGGKHVAGSQRGREVVASLLVHAEIVLVKCLQ